ncbi:MAG: class I SAM-dependent methyltransferase [bacterium]
MNRVREYFGKVASEWDRIREGYFDESVVAKMLEVFPLRDTMVVVDMGTGTGFVALGLAPFVKKVIGIDASEEMLAVARRNMSERGIRNVEFKVGDIEDIPLEGSSVDAVFGNMVLHHAPHPGRAIRELARIVKPGGGVALTDLDAHENEWFRREMADLWMGFKREDVRRWFEDAGLRDVLVDCVGSNCCAESSEGKGLASVSIFIARGVK